MTISFDDFLKVDIRVGEIIEIEDFAKAHKPTYKLKIDFGPEIGVKQSSAQFKVSYTPEELRGSQCLAVVNFEPKNIAGFMSEVLVLGVDKEDGTITRIRPDQKAKLGARLY